MTIATCLAEDLRSRRIDNARDAAAARSAARTTTRVPSQIHRRLTPPRRAFETLTPRAGAGACVASSTPNKAQ